MSILNKKNIMVPTNDYVFKRIFGQIGNEEITKGLLSAIIDEKIESLSLDENKILEKELFDEKIGILDIKARLNNKVLCDVEMQVINHKDMENRMLFYWSKLYTSGIKSGEKYSSLNKTIVILLLNYELENLKEILKGHTEWKIRESTYKNTVLTEMFEVHIIEMSKIKRLMKSTKLAVDDEKIEKWIKFLLMPDELEEKDMEDNEALKKAKEELEKIQNDKYEERMAELRMKHILDTKAVEEYGYDKGKKEGKIEGKIEKQKEIAKKLLEKSFSIEEIIEVTGISKEEIEKL